MVLKIADLNHKIDKIFLIFLTIKFVVTNLIVSRLFKTLDQRSK
jgi:hypothetical protein